MDEIPEIIKQVGFDFNWDEKKVRKLDISKEMMSIDELTWHFEIPFWNYNGGYNLKPIDVINNPEKYNQEYERTMLADLSYPIDIMQNKGKWLILDGLHRLLKYYILGDKYVNIRKIPREKIPDIVI